MLSDIYRRLGWHDFAPYLTQLTRIHVEMSQATVLKPREIWNGNISDGFHFVDWELPAPFAPWPTRPTWFRDGDKRALDLSASHVTRDAWRHCQKM